MSACARSFLRLPVERPLLNRCISTGKSALTPQRLQVHLDDYVDYPRIWILGHDLISPRMTAHWKSLGGWLHASPFGRVAPSDERHSLGT
jgi:hypothetical protein